MNKWTPYLIAGGVVLVTGVVLLIKRNLAAVLLFLVGLALLVAGFSLMLKTSGHSADGAYGNGVQGQGRQQSEVFQLEQPVVGEQDPGIWDKMVNKK